MVFMVSVLLGRFLFYGALEAGVVARLWIGFSADEASMLPDWLKQTIRAQINGHLVQTCTIERYVDAASTNLGAPKRVLKWSVESPCFLKKESMNTANPLVNEADKGKVFYELELPYDTEIADGDSVIVDGERYETRQVLSRQSQDVMVQARLVKVGS